MHSLNMNSVSSCISHIKGRLRVDCHKQIPSLSTVGKEKWQQKDGSQPYVLTALKESRLSMSGPSSWLSTDTLSMSFFSMAKLMKTCKDGRNLI